MARLTRKRWMRLLKWAEVLASDLSLQDADTQELRQHLIEFGAGLVRRLDTFDGHESYIFVSMRRERHSFARDRLKEECACQALPMGVKHHHDPSECMELAELVESIEAQLSPSEREVFDEIKNLSLVGKGYGIQREVTRRLGCSPNRVWLAMQHIRRIVVGQTACVTRLEVSDGRGARSA